MKIDLHIHSKECSDGKLTLSEIFREARQRSVELISITDHDNVDCQELAGQLAAEHRMGYISGVELGISFPLPFSEKKKNRSISLDVLGYGYDIHDRVLGEKLLALRRYRRIRIEKILERLNPELERDGFPKVTREDLETLEEEVHGALGRPHLADFLVKRGTVRNRQKAFDIYLVACNVPKMPLSLEEASELIRGAGGKLILAHPNNPGGTSLFSISSSPVRQQQVIRETMLPFLDGIECWHSSHDPETATSYLRFAQQNRLMVTGGSDCHQHPVVIGTVNVPEFVARQFEVS